MEYKLIVKNYNGLYIIYLTKFYKVLIGIIYKVIVGNKGKWLLFRAS